jgi:uncharacterized DUF497 family protein
MELKVSAFDWDDGNRDKCQKHGLSMSDVEHVLVSARNLMVRDVKTRSRKTAISPLEKPALGDSVLWSSLCGWLMIS